MLSKNWVVYSFLLEIYVLLLFPLPPRFVMFQCVVPKLEVLGRVIKVAIASFDSQCPAKHTRDCFSINNLGVHLEMLKLMPWLSQKRMRFG